MPPLFPAVRNVRELKRGVQADVVIGEDPATHSVVTVQVIASSARVLNALEALKHVLQQEAHIAIRNAQDDEQRRGHKPLGR